MTTLGKTIVCAGALLLALGAGAAWADPHHGHWGGGHGGVRFGLYLGGPLLPSYPPAYYYPYGYPPPVVYPSPPVYVAPPPPMPQPTYWYYCKSPPGYYPYVKECPQGWIRVVPQASQ